MSLRMRNRAGALVAVSTAAAFLAVISGYAAAAGLGLQSPAATAAPADDGLLNRYCVGCHTETQRRLGNVPIALDTLERSDIGASAETWERVVRKLRAGMLHPADGPRPDRRSRDAFVLRLETELDRAAAARPNPGRTEPLRRLSRAEYQYAIRDLLDLEMDVASLLPSDEASGGFGDSAGALKPSRALMERYLSAAQTISRTAIGTPPPVPNIDYFRVADDLSQDHRLPGLSFGTRGGTQIRYTFPVDAEYAIRVELQRDLNESIPTWPEPQFLEVSIDGDRVHVFTLPGVPAARAQAGAPVPGRGRGDGPAAGRGRGEGQGTGRGDEPGAAQGEEPAAGRGRGRGRGEGPVAGRSRPDADRDWQVRVPVKAGTRDVQVAFLKQTSAVAETARLPFQRPYPAGTNITETRTGAHLRSVEISGPYETTGPGETPSRRRIFLCRPADVRAEPACARTILAALARRAYRRPVTDADLEPLLALYREGRAEAGFEDGIGRALRLLLVSPEFLLRIEREPAAAGPGRPYRISDLELASRLSFFLWSSIPDGELLDLAERGQLRDPAVLERQVRRMVADDRFGRFVEDFAGQWLSLRNLSAVVPVQSSFPDFDDSLRQAFRRETELFVESIAREDRSALDLLRADYTFLNERLARHYGIPNVKGSRFRRVSLAPDSHRGGLLGQGSLLTVTSYPDRTSPVARGKWILESLLGTPPPASPADMPELEPTSFADSVPSMRERIARHRTNAACASCHAVMDPIGLALENFDGVGAWRSLDESGAPIDASGALPDGTLFDGPAGLARALLGSGLFVTTLTERMLTDALGRGLDYHDAPAIRSVVREAARADNRFVSIVLGIVRSEPFQMRMKDG